MKDRRKDKQSKRTALPLLNRVGNKIITYDLSVIEDHNSWLKLMRQIAAKAAMGAVAEARVSKLVRVYSRGDKLFQVNRKGKETAFKGMIQGKPLYVKYKPATKFYVSIK